MSYYKIYSKGTAQEYKKYFKNKKCKIIHREDGPALEYPGYYKAWFKIGYLHREDGPAVENTDINNKYNFAFGYGNHYFLDDREYSEKDYWSIIKLGAFI